MSAKKITMTWDLSEPGDEKDFLQAFHGGDCALALWEIQQEVFRPARKHGYSNDTVATLIRRLNEAVDTHYASLSPEERPSVEDLIGQLEQLFLWVIEKQGVNLSNLVY